MKRLIWLFFIGLTMGHIVKAQPDLSQFDFIGPESGDFLIEVTGTPFEGSSLLNFGSLRARYFLSEWMVPRLGIQFNINDQQVTPDVVTRIVGYGLSPGLEYHFQDQAFRAYGAVDVILSFQNAQRESTTSPNIIGSTQIPSSPNYYFNHGQRGYREIGVALNFGAEYHFESRFYLGMEVGFYYVGGKTREVKVDGDLFQEGTTYNMGGLLTNNAFRIGFKLF